MIKRICRAAAAVCFAGAAFVFGTVGLVQARLPEVFSVREGETLCLPTAILSAEADGALPTQTSSGGHYAAKIKLFGVFPVSQVQVDVVEPRDVAVCGMPFGLKMFTQGVLVVGIGDVDSRRGGESPARNAGLRVGDSILTVNGEEVATTEQVASLIEQSGGHALTLGVRRQQVEFEVRLTPVASVSEKKLKAGMWIRDSSAGIGTLTFYDMTSGVFAGLGHPVHDVDTGESVPISSGEIVPASIFGVTRGQAGAPGELLGSFREGSWGILTMNDDTGLYGLLSEQPDAYATLSIACKQEVTAGEAQLLTTVDGMTPQLYDVVIESVDYRDEVPTRNLVIRITDETLLEKTGGVLCGMSGSPILQNGKLVAAVTHVFVGDPTGGYAIFAETMLRRAAEVPVNELQDAA